MSAAATPTPLVAEGLRIRGEIDRITARRDAIALELRAANDELTALEQQLIDLGPGRYCDDAQHFASVIGSIPSILSPDTFALQSLQAEQTARDIASDDFRKLFNRHVSWAPKPDFRGLVLATLGPKTADQLLALTIIPGKPTGGRAAHVRWK